MNLLTFKFPPINWPTLPSHPRGWILTTLLGLTTVYILVGLVFAWQLYVGGNISKRALAYYPFAAARAGTNIIPATRYFRDVTAISQYIRESGTGESYNQLNIERQVMSRLIDAALYERIAHRYGVVVTAEEVEAAYRQSVAEEEEPVERILSQYYGFTPADFKVWVAEFLLEEKVRTEVPKRRHLHHILVAVDQSASEETVKAAEEKANSLLNQLKEGSDFAELAKRESNDLTTRDAGGSFGMVTRGPAASPLIDKEFENAAFAAPIGELVGPVRSTRGWHLILVSEENGRQDLHIDDILMQERQRVTVTIFIPINEQS